MSRLLPAAQLAALQPHPLAALMPPMSDAQYSALRTDVDINGQRQVITLLDGRILDGRNRTRALIELGRGGSVVDLPTGIDPINYVLSNNVARRQLTPSQSAMIAARLVTTRQGVTAADDDVSQAAAAERLSVSTRYVRDAQWLTEHDLPLSERVFAGELTLAAAMRQARPAPPRAEREVLIDPHPPIAEVLPVTRAEEGALLAGIRAMDGVDPGEWVQALPEGPSRRAIVLLLESFARRAYDIAEEAGLLDAAVAAATPARAATQPGAGGITVIASTPAAIAAARARGER